MAYLLHSHTLVHIYFCFFACDWLMFRHNDLSHMLCIEKLYQSSVFMKTFIYFLYSNSLCSLSTPALFIYIYIYIYTTCPHAIRHRLSTTHTHYTTAYTCRFVFLIHFTLLSDVGSRIVSPRIPYICRIVYKFSSVFRLLDTVFLLLNSTLNNNLFVCLI